MLCLFNVRARGRSSGAELDPELTTVLSFSEGEIVRIQAFQDRAEGYVVSGFPQPDRG